jgi:hypothetical protein
MNRSASRSAKGHRSRSRPWKNPWRTTTSRRLIVTLAAAASVAVAFVTLGSSRALLQHNPPEADIVGLSSGEWKR